MIFKSRFVNDSFKVSSLKSLIVVYKNNDNLKSLYRTINTFKCNKLGKDEEYFLKHQSINFEMENKSRTYLIFKDNSLIAYFTLTFKSIDLSRLSKNKSKKLTAGESNDKNYPSYLIGHIAKDERVKIKNFISYILDQCLFILFKSQKLIGGRLVYLDCKDSFRLIKMYEDYGFRYFNRNENSGLKQYYLLLKEE